MKLRAAYASLDRSARAAFLASFMGWTLDAFDFFLVTFVAVHIAGDFRTSIVAVGGAITLTLMFRPLGALIFGWIGDRYGRRTPLMVDILLFSALELLTAFSPNLLVFIVLRALYGIAMGGEWGLGAALAMESLPPQRRGLFSGILQEGYMVGYLLAALAYFLVFTFTPWGWRGLFVIGALPALLVFYIRSHVTESPVWQTRRQERADPMTVLRAGVKHLPLVLYAILFMAAFNFMSHGTQDLYATFLQKQHGYSAGATASLSIIAAIGAILGGIVFGGLSQRFGRRSAILVCASLAIVVIPLWMFGSNIALLAVGAFLMQFFVQGAWGVVPAHLNEISPPDARGTFPGFTYQIGNLISAGAFQIEAAFATTHFALPNGGANYAAAMAIIALVVLTAVIVLTAIGYLVTDERRDATFA
ncbi:MAG: MFS transporter [Vulcanimicrobiaceae bacterium]